MGRDRSNTNKDCNHKDCNNRKDCCCNDHKDCNSHKNCSTYKACNTHMDSVNDVILIQENATHLKTLQQKGKVQERAVKKRQTVASPSSLASPIQATETVP
ncbi:hypothetical protein ACOMHN_061297 [Nucella lapillus]